jgi:hypothetical protein
MDGKTIIGVLVTAALAANAAPATAGEPAAGCPTNYELFALPPDGSWPTGEALDAAGNADGFICRKPFRSLEHPGAPYNIIDNRAQAG